MGINRLLNRITFIQLIFKKVSLTIITKIVIEKITMYSIAVQNFNIFNIYKVG